MNVGWSNEKNTWNFSEIFLSIEFRWKFETFFSINFVVVRIWRIYKKVFWFEFPRKSTWWREKIDLDIFFLVIQTRHKTFTKTSRSKMGWNLISQVHCSVHHTAASHHTTIETIINVRKQKKSDKRFETFPFFSFLSQGSKYTTHKEKTKNCWQGRFSTSSLLFSCLSPLTFSILSSHCCLFYLYKSTPSFHHHSGRRNAKSDRKILHFPFCRRRNFHIFHDVFIFSTALLRFSKLFAT